MESPKSPKEELEEETSEQKYEDLVMFNLDLQSEVSDKSSELLELKKMCEELESVFNQESAQNESTRQEWMKYKEDVFKTVHEVVDFGNDCIEEIKSINVEKVVLEEKVARLERELESLMMGAGEPQPLSGNSNKNNTPAEVPLCDEPMSSDSVDSSRCPSVELVQDKMPHGDNKENDYHPSDNDSDSNISNGNSLKRLNVRNNKAKESVRLQDTDPLITLRSVAGGSKRNALLRWCQNRTEGYNVEILDFSKSWSDGMALNALLHSYLPDLIPYEALSPQNCEDNFKIAFKAAETASIPSSLSIDDMLSADRPSWEKVMNYIKEIYSVLEGCN